jgi:hypothetical protein
MRHSCVILAALALTAAPAVAATISTDGMVFGEEKGFLWVRTAKAVGKLKLTNDTVITQNGKKTTRKALKRGQSIRVEYDGDDFTVVKVEIRKGRVPVGDNKVEKGTVQGVLRSATIRGLVMMTLEGKQVSLLWDPKSISITLDGKEFPANRLGAALGRKAQIDYKLEYNASGTVARATATKLAIYAKDDLPALEDDDTNKKIVVGTLQSFRGKTLAVRLPGGGAMTFYFTDKARIYKDGEQAGAKDFAKGQEIRVLYQETGLSINRATRIDVFTEAQQLGFGKK